MAQTINVEIGINIESSPIQSEKWRQLWDLVLESPLQSDEPEHPDEDLIQEDALGVLNV